ncbi:MAG: ABC transporter permease subunit [Pirellulaceae bacterium]|nr:ABC transporter permease subunit [Pirellulaceae bacterium]
MGLINSVFATVQFELLRVLTLRRLSVAVIMALFPPMMLFFLQAGGALAAPVFIMTLFCGMICLLSLLLWSTSNVYAELEGKSWTFITSRPYGRWSILFGKFFVAFLVSFLISWVALSLCMLVTADLEFNILQLVDDTDVSKLRIWLSLSGLLFLASMVYAAIFSLFGVLIQRRAMAAAVVFFVVVEVALAVFPAVVGKFAMTFHMFCLLTHWVGWIPPADSTNDDSNQILNDFILVYGRQDSWVHLAVIFATTVLSLSVAAYVICKREYITLEDSQV